MFGEWYGVKVGVRVRWNRNERVWMLGVDFVGISGIGGVGGIVGCERIVLIGEMGVDLGLKDVVEEVGMEVFEKVGEMGLCVEVGKEVVG